MDKKIATPRKENSYSKTPINDTPKRAPYKIELCLMELLTRGDSGLVELEALQAYGDTALHSTISTLANSHGLTFKRAGHRHKSKRGPITIFTRYSLADDEQIVKAKALIKRYRASRGLVALEAV